MLKGAAKLRLGGLFILLAALQLLAAPAAMAGHHKSPAHAALAVICTDGGTATVDLHATQPADPDEPGSPFDCDHPCGWCCSAAEVRQPEQAAAVTSSDRLPTSHPAPALRPGLGLAAPPPPATGPPSLI